ncbi:MAG: hypothetical protein CMI06_06180 [Oceanospirillaceae bacterium]|jgi:uncharacterized protein YecE (DUF72 family)|nr:hypothetical protein [Oceanospirillaceae bacterium]
MTNDNPLAHPFPLTDARNSAQLYLGLPMWFMPDWKGGLLNTHCGAADALSSYSQVFSSVEGNTTFYGLPSADRAERWARQVPEHFRFCFKVPKSISHAENIPRQLLKEGPLLADFITPLRERIGVLLLQLPASFTPQRSAELFSALEILQRLVKLPLAVECRHPGFFLKDQHEVTLLQELKRLAVNRVVFDSRGLFRDGSITDAVIHAQSKKPRMPVHPLATAQNPVVRFIGHSDWQQNLLYLQQWQTKIQQWLREGRSPYFFVHTAGNHDCPEFARYLVRFWQGTMADWPGEGAGGNSAAGNTADLFA